MSPGAQLPSLRVFTQPSSVISRDPAELLAHRTEPGRSAAVSTVGEGSIRTHRGSAGSGNLVLRLADVPQAGKEGVIGPDYQVDWIF